ncbi:MAG: hypothetical protein ACTSUE_05065 [Promethearchaeota archaeon]
MITNKDEIKIAPKKTQEKFAMYLGNSRIYLDKSTARHIQNKPGVFVIHKLGSRYINDRATYTVEPFEELRGEYKLASAFYIKSKLKKGPAENPIKALDGMLISVMIEAPVIGVQKELFYLGEARYNSDKMKTIRMMDVVRPKWVRDFVSFDSGLSPLTTNSLHMTRQNSVVSETTPTNSLYLLDSDEEKTGSGDTIPTLQSNPRKKSKQQSPKTDKYPDLNLQFKLCRQIYTEMSHSLQFLQDPCEKGKLPVMEKPLDGNLVVPISQKFKQYQTSSNPPQNFSQLLLKLGDKLTGEMLCWMHLFFPDDSTGLIRFLLEEEMYCATPELAETLRTHYEKVQTTVLQSRSTLANP